MHFSIRMGSVLFFVGCAWALPQPPSYFSVSPTNAQVTLEWRQVPGATAYNVKRAGSVAGLLAVVATNIVGTSYEDLNLRNGTQYFYTVSAVDDDGEGSDTLRLRAVPSAPVLNWLPAGANVEKLAGNFQFTEGPVWMPEGFLIFSDIPANRLYKWTPTEGSTVFRANSGQANGNTVDLQGRLLTGEHNNRRVTRTELDGTVTALVTNYNGRRFNAPNDLAVKSDGTVWFTDPNYGISQLQPGRWVYRFDPADPAGTLRTVATNFVQPNGIAFSLDEKKLYVADSSVPLPHHVRVFDVLPDNTLTNSTVFAVISPGAPDGIRVGPDGSLYVTAMDGVQVFNPEGTLIGKILTPETAANVCLGGTNQEMMFITASTSLFGVTGKPDYVITSFQRVPGGTATRAGQMVRFLCVVKNQGTGTASAAESRVSISIDGQTNVLASDVVGRLRPDSSVVVACDTGGEGWLATAGTHRAYAFVDFANRLSESNERNNQTNVAFVVSDAPADGDQDGLSDSDEVVAKTDPSSVNSLLRILDIQKTAGGEIRLDWSSVPEVQYRVSTKQSLGDLHWVDFPQNIVSVGTVTSWTNRLAERALFKVRIAP